MKVLTVRQPWAAAIIHLRKDVENRSYRTNHRGRLYIHAAKKLDVDGMFDPTFEEALDLYITPNNGGVFAQITPLEIAEGMVIGTVDIIDCHHADDCKGWAQADSLCSEWAQPDTWHWVLANPHPIEIPFEAKGQLGIWNLGPSSVEELVP